MGESTGIGWTDHTWNPWIGCQRVSPGCEHCYAEQATPTRVQRAKGLELWGPPTTTQRKRTAPDNWRNPLRWNAAAQRDGVRRRMFVASLADVFEDHPQAAEWRPYALAILAKCTSLDVQLLTKRPENIRRMVPPEWLESWPAHVWVGTTVEDQKRADQRIPHLLDVPARVRFLSVEPLLESVDLTAAVAELFCMKCRTPATIAASADPESTPEEDRAQWVDPECPHACPKCGGETDGRYPDDRIDWVIVGGESGTSAREFNLGWCRSIVDQCVASAVPVFVKQMGDHATVTERECPAGGGCGLDECAGGCHYGREETHREHFRAHHGADPAEWPKALRRQEFPAAGAR